MFTSLIALAVAIGAVLGLVITLALASLVLGALERYFGGPKITYLTSNKSKKGFAFAFNWDESKEPAKIDYIKVKLFNPKGNPSQLEMITSFGPYKTSCVEDLDLGEVWSKFIGATHFDEAQILVEVGSSTDGVVFQFNYNGKSFKSLLDSAKESAQSYIAKNNKDAAKSKAEEYSIPERSFIATEVQGKGAYLKIATNPIFADKFSPLTGGSSTAGEAKESVPNFLISKVWIEPGCIVCDACEGIYPEVFEVTADTCIIRAGAPLDNGLLVQEAAEACPVEVIKYTAA